MVLVELPETSLYGFETGLLLSLISRKDTIDSFLKEHPDISHDPYWSDIALVARIVSIRSSYSLGEYGYNLGEYGEPIDLKIGDGELVEILYTGDVEPVNLTSRPDHMEELD